MATSEASVGFYSKMPAQKRGPSPKRSSSPRVPTPPPVGPILSRRASIPAMSGPSKTPNNPRISAFQSFAPTTTVSTVRKVKQPAKDEPMASSSSSSSEEAKAPIRLQALPPRQELGKLMVVRSRKPRLSPPPVHESLNIIPQRE